MHQTAPCSPHIIAYWKALPRWKCLWPVIKIARTLDELRLAYSPSPKTYPQAPAGTKKPLFFSPPAGPVPKI